MKPMKEFLSDGVYVVWDGQSITLAIEDGSQVNNRIALEPEALDRFFAYLEQCTAEPSANL